MSSRYGDDEEDAICRKEPTDYDDRRAFEEDCEDAKEVCEPIGTAVGGAAGGAGFVACEGLTGGTGSMACFFGGIAAYELGSSVGEGVCEAIVERTNESCRRADAMSDRDLECAKERAEEREEQEERDGSRNTSDAGGGDRYAAADTSGPSGSPSTPGASGSRANGIA